MEKFSKYLYIANKNGNIILYHPISNQYLKMLESEYQIFLSVTENIELFKKEYPSFYFWLSDKLFIVTDEELELNIIRTMNKKNVFSDKNYWLTINPTLNCNLDCWYCSVKETTKQKFKGGMRQDVIESIIKHIEHMVYEEKITGLHLDWFGGEPLLYFEKVIKPIVAYSNDFTRINNIKLTTHITTNGTLLTPEMIFEFQELKINSFQITIDGSKEKHDAIKYFKNKKISTFDITIQNIIFLLENIINSTVTLRINFDSKTLNDIQNVLNSFPIELRERIQIDFHRIFQLNKINEINMSYYINKCREMGYVSRYWAFRPQRFYTCYSDKFYHAAINFDGNVYKCTARNYSENNQVGKLLSSGRIEYNNKLLEMFSKANFENEKCTKCKYLPMCFGPCIQSAYESKNNPFKCYIDDWEMNLEEYIISEYEKNN